MTQRLEISNLDTPVGRFLRRVYGIAASVTLAGGVVLSLWGAPIAALNVGAGAILSGAIIRYTQVLVQRFLVPGAQLQAHRRWFMILMLVKLPVLVILFFLVVQASWFHPVGFLAGVSILPGLIALYGGMKALKPETTQDEIYHNLTNPE